MTQSESSFTDLHITRDRVSIITIDREDKLNALSADVLSQLRDATRSLAADQQVRAVVITGRGTRAFAAGADIAELASIADYEQGLTLSAHGQTIFSQFGECALPLIAALNGAALGGGLELAMACDLRVAAPQAKLGLPEVALGLLPGFGGTQRLAQLVGPSRALRMMFTAKPISAEEAYRIGLVDVLADDGDALATAIKLAESIAQYPPGALAAVKSSVQTGLEFGVEAGLLRERELFGHALLGHEGRAGLESFLSRRSAS